MAESSDRKLAEPYRAELEDPVWRSSLREALVILATWCGFCVFTIGVSFLLGAGTPAAEVRLIFGIPSWVVWGVIVPWIAAVIFAGWFCFGFVEDHELEGNDDPEHESAPQSSLGQLSEDGNAR